MVAADDSEMIGFQGVNRCGSLAVDPFLHPDRDAVIQNHSIVCVPAGPLPEIGSRIHAFTLMIPRSTSLNQDRLMAR